MATSHRTPRKQIVYCTRIAIHWKQWIFGYLDSVSKQIESRNEIQKQYVHTANLLPCSKGSTAFFFLFFVVLFLSFSNFERPLSLSLALSRIWFSLISCSFCSSSDRHGSPIPVHVVISMYSSSKSLTRSLAAIAGNGGVHVCQKIVWPLLVVPLCLIHGRETCGSCIGISLHGWCANNAGWDLRALRGVPWRCTHYKFIIISVGAWTRGSPSRLPWIRDWSLIVYLRSKHI